jgi:hypothetical protein
MVLAVAPAKAVNNDSTSLPISFQFGSHVGTGLVLEL